MDQASIASVMSKAVGDPVSGVVADNIPAMAAAVARALNGEKEAPANDGGPATEDAAAEKRVIKAAETR